MATKRFDYSSSIADSWKEQTLLNIVKLRHPHLKVFMDVSSIVACYSPQTGVITAAPLRPKRRFGGQSDCTKLGRMLWFDFINDLCCAHFAGLVSSRFASKMRRTSSIVNGLPWQEWPLRTMNSDSA
jgi:hypothetical protein